MMIVTIELIVDTSERDIKDILKDIRFTPGVQEIKVSL